MRRLLYAYQRQNRQKGAAPGRAQFLRQGLLSAAAWLPHQRLHQSLLPAAHAVPAARRYLHLDDVPSVADMRMLQISPACQVFPLLSQPDQRKERQLAVE